MVDPYAIVRRLTGHELISPKDARLLTEAVDGLIGEIGSKDARITELEAEAGRLKQELAATQEKLFKANDELIQRRAEALSRTGAVKVSYANSTAPNRPFTPTPSEGQQEPVAWHFEHQDGDGNWEPMLTFSKPARSSPVRCVEPLYTRPSEQAVTDAMVEAAVQSVRQYTRDTLFIDEHRELVRTALKAAMEATHEA